MVHTKLIIRAVFGIIGNVISFGLFASAMPTFYKVIKNKSVEELKPDCYLLTTIGCLFWVLYGMPFIHPGFILVLTANGIGHVIHLAYLIIFLLYAKDNKQRMYVGGVFLIEMALVGLVSGLVIGLAPTGTRAVYVGVFSFIFGSLMIIPRMILAITVCDEKSVECMPFLVALSNTLNDLCWLIYASLKFDRILWLPCCGGFSLGVVQLVIHGVYYKSTPKSDVYKKLAKAEVQLRGIGIGDDKKLAIDEVQGAALQLQEIDTGDDKKQATATGNCHSLVEDDHN